MRMGLGGSQRRDITRDSEVMILRYLSLLSLSSLEIRVNSQLTFWDAQARGVNKLFKIFCCELTDFSDFQGHKSTSTAANGGHY